MTKVYLTGPMSWKPQFNIPAFDALEDILTEMGFEVVSPPRLDGDDVREFSLASPDGNPDTYATHGMTKGDFMARDLKYLVDDGIDIVVVLPGWEQSEGSLVETFVAYHRGIHICTYRGAALWDVPRLTLYRAWTKDPNVIIYRQPFRQEVAPV